MVTASAPPSSAAVDRREGDSDLPASGVLRRAVNRRRKRAQTSHSSRAGRSGRDVGHPIEQEVFAEVSEVVAHRLEGEDAASGSELGGIQRVEADVGANVVEDIAVAGFSRSHCIVSGSLVAKVSARWCSLGVEVRMAMERPSTSQRATGKTARRPARSASITCNEAASSLEENHRLMLCSKPRRKPSRYKNYQRKIDSR